MIFKNRPKVFIDFEYNSSREKYLNLVSCCLCVDDAMLIECNWLLDRPEQKVALRDRLLQLKSKKAVFVAFNVVAEAQSFYALKLDPTDFDWIDLQAEWKMLTNHFNKYAYGKQLINGSVVYTTAPELYETSDVSSQRCEKSFAAMCFKILNLKVDTERKNMMRDIILSCDDKLILKHREEILEYNESDVVPMPDLWQELIKIYRQSPLKRIPQSQITALELLARGQAVADTALITSFGYPVDVSQIKTFMKNVPNILNSCCKDINSQFTKSNFFEFNEKTNTHTMKQKPLKDWIKTTPYKSKWLVTAKGDLSLSLDAFVKHFDFKHDYPRDNVGAQIVRFLKLKQSLNGFMPKRKKDQATFLDYVGSDHRVRPYLNPYGSQTSRFQPKTVAFIPLKAAWMRSMIVPKSGRAIVGIDYASEEFLISAVLSGDKNMLDAYKSGDVYLHFAKLAGAVPMDGTKEKYKKERDKFKSTTLGISYLMSSEALSNKLTLDTGEFHTTDQAQELINTFFEVFKDYHNFIETEQHEYIFRQFSKLADGWVMFGDNPNRRSVANFPVQGMGAVILRRAIRYCLKEKLRVIFPLHDALYIEVSDRLDQLKVKIDLIHDLMHEAFYKSFTTEKQQHDAKAIRLDINAWGNGLEEGIGLTHNQRKYKSQKIYIDERAVNEYTYFKKYLK